ncbi:MAG TPA: F0F1 ATP synthase subunit B [Gemmatimonadales bacterium]|jgi:F-type H+-transporting ATPase subunit b
MPLFALILLAEEGAGGLGGPFALEPGLIIWTWLVFGALFLLLRKYAFPPILRLTVEREKKIAKQLEAAERANVEAQKALEDHRRLLASAKDEAQAFLNEAKSLAQKEREQLLAKARDEQQQLVDRAKQDIAGEREHAIAELRQEAVDLVLAAATKLVGEQMNVDADRRLVERYLASLERAR